jgi:hypothetical protein
MPITDMPKATAAESFTYKANATGVALIVEEHDRFEK